MTSASDQKWRPFNCLLSVQGKGGSPTGSGPEYRVGDQDTVRPGRPVCNPLCAFTGKRKEEDMKGKVHCTRYYVGPEPQTLSLASQLDVGGWSYATPWTFYHREINPVSMV